MAQYIESNLTSNEKIVLEAKVSWWSQLSVFILGVCFLLSAIGGKSGISLLIALAFFAIAVIRVISTELALTTKRVIAKTGFIRRDTVELKLDKVEGLAVSQGIFGRMLNYGNIVVTGTGGLRTPIPFISNPIEFRNIFNEYMEHPEKFIEN